jgi:hypothetical protein
MERYSMDQPPRTPGRPRKPPAKVRRATFKFRVTDRLRDQLAGAAGAEGRSISEEIEHRLARTFREDALLGGSLHLRMMAQDVGNVLCIFEMITGRRAFGPGADRWLHQQVENAFGDWFDRTRPPGQPQVPEAITALGVGADFVAGAAFGDLAARWDLLPEERRPEVRDEAIEQLRGLLSEIIRVFTEERLPNA